MRISKTTKIGALTLIALFLLYFGLNYLKGFNVFKRANVYYAAFPEVKNVNIASAILVSALFVLLNSFVRKSKLFRDALCDG